VGAVLGLTLVLASCGDGKSSGSSSSGSKSEVIAIAADPLEYINPLNENGSPGIQVAMAMFAPLVTTDPNTGKLQNVIADSVTPDKTSQTWTIKLKPGNTFQNGQPLTAKDYVDSWNMTAEGSNACTQWSLTPAGPRTAGRTARFAEPSAPGKFLAAPPCRRR
jgi:peptide/nickel transport system substrate-binding protein/oligopeptide transport system substrate-binding protein